MTSTDLYRAGARLIVATHDYVHAVEAAINPPAPGERVWPFADDAAWNTELPTDVQLADDAHETTRNLASVKGTVNRDQWSVAFYVARREDPLATIIGARTGNVATAYVPSGAHPTGGDDRHVFVLQPDGSGWDCYKFARQDDEHYTAEVLIDIDTINGSGINDGTRAARTPCLAGLILARDPIRHALALALPATCLKVGYVPPAAAEDADAETSYSGTIPMGTRLAIPRDAPCPDTEAGARLHAALSTHGTITADRSSSATLYCELDTDAQIADDYKSAWQQLLPLLRVVL